MNVVGLRCVPHRVLVICSLALSACPALTSRTPGGQPPNAPSDGGPLAPTVPDAGAASNPDTDGDCAAGLPWLTVPVRFHLVRSTIESLNATLEPDEVRAVLDEAAVEWEQACVRFSVESIVEGALTAAQEQQFQQRIDDGFADKRTLMRDAMPVDNLLSPGWNVMVFPMFAAPASGIYMGEIESVLWAEKLPPVAPPGDNPPLILAHEFGHAFGLRHYEGPDQAENLMNADVIQTRTTAHGLTAEQIESARAQVESGDTAPP